VISGAIQHWAGCSLGEDHHAINTDAEAPMVTKAHYAVIGDLHDQPAINARPPLRAGRPTPPRRLPCKEKALQSDITFSRESS
jgi:hypothetical protein